MHIYFYELAQADGRGRLWASLSLGECSRQVQEGRSVIVKSSVVSVPSFLTRLLVLSTAAPQALNARTTPTDLKVDGALKAEK